MKVLQLSSEMSWRGGEQQLAYLIGELENAGVENFILAKKNSAFYNYSNQHFKNTLASSFNGQFDFSTSLLIKSFCAKNNIDVIHAHSSHSHALVVWSAVLGNKTPVVVSRRVDFPVSKNFISSFKYKHLSVKKFICVSQCIKNILSPSLTHADKAVVIYDGVDLNRFDPVQNNGLLRKEFSILPDEKIIANIAALAPHKDYFTWLKTVSLLVGKIKAKFLIIGDGPMKSEIENEIVRLRLMDFVIMTRFRNDLEKIFPEIDALLFTSEEEGLGSTLLDAMICGVPVVSTNAGGIPEIVKHEQNGLLSNVYDAASLAENVIRLFSDKMLQQKLIANGKLSVVNFSKSRMAEETLRVYNQF